MDTREDESQAFTVPVINPFHPLYLYPLEEDKHQNSHDPLSRPTDSHPDHHHPSTGTFPKTREHLSEQAIAEQLKPRSAIVEEWLRATEGEGNDGEDLSSHQTHKDIPTWDDDENFSNQLLFVLRRDGESGESGGVEQEKNTTKIFSHRKRSRKKKAEGEIITLEQICRAPWALPDVPDAEAVPPAVARPYSIKIHSLNTQGDEFTESTNPMSGRIESCQSPEEEKGGSLPGSQDLPDFDKEDEKKGGGLKKVEFNIPPALLTAQVQSQGEQQSETSHMTPSPMINTNRTKGSSPSIHPKRFSRSPVATNIMREIRKMSLASQDAREERKKASKAASATEGSPPTAGGTAPTPGTSSNPSAHSGDSQNAKRTAKRLSRRRKRREEEYTDKDRAAAVTLGSRDIKQSLKAKKKRERKLHISIDLLHSEEFLSSMLFCEAAYQMRVKQEPKSAIITLNKALDLQPAHKGALVARSQCHLKLGDAASALKDAQTSFKGNDTFIMGLYQCAEALYNLGQFEKALIAYHRGYRLRKLENFRIGIQKSQEAIRRAIGDTSATRMEDLDNILPLIDQLDAFRSTGKSSYSSTEDRRILDSLEGSSSTGIDATDRSTPNTTTASVTNNGSSTNSQNGTPNTAPIPSGGTGRTSPARTPSHQPDHLSPLPKEPNLPIIPVAIKLHPSTAPSQASKAKEKWVAREVLGQMYFDKDYLIKFLHRPDVQRGHGASEELRSYAAEALNYLENREGFWRQQNPMYARKQVASSTISKSGSSPLEENPTNKSRHISGGNSRTLAINPSRSPASSSTSPSSTNPINSRNLLKGKENLIGKTG